MPRKRDPEKKDSKCQRVQRATPVEKLRAFIYTFLLRLSDKGVPAWHMKLILQEITDHSGTLGQMVENSVRPLYRYLVGILYELIDGDEPSEEESGEIFLCAMSIVGQCLHHFLARRIISAMHPKSFDPSDIDRIADHITRFSLAGIKELNHKEDI